MKDITEKNKNKASLFTLCFAILIAISGLFSMQIATSHIPLVLQNMMPILAGSILGGVQGAGATGLFLVLGVLGLPVFANMTSGIETVMGETGGYIIGYFIASLIVGLLIGKPNKEELTPLPKIISSMLIGFIVMYIPGTVQYVNATQISFQEAIQTCIMAFLPYDACKLVIAIIITVKARPFVASHISLK